MKKVSPKLVLVCFSSTKHFAQLILLNSHGMSLELGAGVPTLRRGIGGRTSGLARAGGLFDRFWPCFSHVYFEGQNLNSKMWRLSIAVLFKNHHQRRSAMDGSSKLNNNLIVFIIDNDMIIIDVNIE